MRIAYQGGVYEGSVRCVKSKRRHRLFIPHGRGRFEIDDVKYIGQFKNGYEDGWGYMIWSTGETLRCHFRGGRPVPHVLRSVHQVQYTRRLNLQLQSELNNCRSENAQLRADLDDCTDRLELEQERTMDVALALDRAQGHLQRIYEAAIAGADAGELQNIRYEN